MSALALGLVEDFAEAARDPDVPTAELAILAQELVAAAAGRPDEVLGALAPLLAELVARVQGWLQAAAGADAEAAAALDEVWRPAVAVLGAWPERRLQLQVVLPEALALARRHEGAAWLARLIAAPHRRPLTLEVPARGARYAGTVTGVADFAQLAVLVNAALAPDLDPSAVASARGEGPQVSLRPVALPWALTVPGEGAPPEHASLPELFGLEEPVGLVAHLDPAPRSRSVGRVFATLSADLELFLA